MLKSDDREMGCISIKNPFMKDGCLLPTNSLNRVKIVDIPEIEMGKRIRSLTGFKLMSRDSFINCVCQNASKLRLNVDEIPYREIPLYFDKCLESEDIEVKLTAEEIARNFGRNLGYILLTLKRGDVINREARVDWEDIHWKFWHNIKNVILAGGLTGGNLGYRVKYHAEKIFEETNTTGYKLKVAENSSMLSMTGAARYAIQNSENSLIFDFGQTFIKRGYAQYNKGYLEKVYKFDSINSLELDDERFIERNEKEQAEKLFEYMISAIIDSYNICEKQGFSKPESICISIASYVSKGKVATGGLYGKLLLISENIEKYFGESLSNILGKSVNAVFVHDGTAAAAYFSGLVEDDTAVITLGTAIGLGFTNSERKLMPLKLPIEYIKL